MEAESSEKIGLELIFNRIFHFFFYFIDSFKDFQKFWGLRGWRLSGLLIDSYTFSPVDSN